MTLSIRPMAEKLEQLHALDPIGKIIGGTVRSVLKPGAFKDLLSGTWLGHPVHPALTDPTIGFWMGATALDFLGGKRFRPAAQRLIGLGILSALPTAVTGLSEFADISSDRPRRGATIHGLGNVGVLALYVASWRARRKGHHFRGVALSTAATGLVSGTAYLGGHLSFGLGIGVNQTAFQEASGEWVSVLTEDELPQGKPVLAEAENVLVMLYRKDGRIYALANRCSHQGGPLNEGDVEGTVVECPWHASRFELSDGSIVRGPATTPQPAYDARISGGRVEVRRRP